MTGLMLEVIGREENADLNLSAIVSGYALAVLFPLFLWVRVRYLMRNDALEERGLKILRRISYVVVGVGILVAVVWTIVVLTSFAGTVAGCV